MQFPLSYIFFFFAGRGKLDYLGKFVFFGGFGVLWGLGMDVVFLRGGGRGEEGRRVCVYNLEM